MFGKTIFMTADAPLTYLLRSYKKEKWVNADTGAKVVVVFCFDYKV